ncbi:MAG: hypothetical protein P4L68_08135 [Methylovirgula sp.]|nr:hypothetical protein [Methylovirgula sp.]
MNPDIGRKTGLAIATIAAIGAAAYYARDFYSAPLQRAFMSREDIANGDACIDLFDNSVYGLVQAVKEQMPDPASFSHVATYHVNYSDNIGTSFLMKYRQRGAQGGMEFAAALGKVNPMTCKAVVTDAGPAGAAMTYLQMQEEEQLMVGRTPAP